MGQGRDVVLFLDAHGDFFGALGGAPAGPIGDADEIRGKLRNPLHHFPHSGNIRAGLRGKNFAGKGDVSGVQELADFHNVPP